MVHQVAASISDSASYQITFVLVAIRSSVDLVAALKAQQNIKQKYRRNLLININ